MPGPVISAGARFDRPNAIVCESDIGPVATTNSCAPPALMSIAAPSSPGIGGVMKLLT